jgi:hypothetical protein
MGWIGPVRRVGRGGSGDGGLELLDGLEREGGSERAQHTLACAQHALVGNLPLLVMYRKVGAPLEIDITINSITDSGDQTQINQLGSGAFGIPSFPLLSFFSLKTENTKQRSD